MDTARIKNKFVRAGIIPYFTIDNKKFCFMFLDKNYGTLIDGGGHVEEGENFVVGATRELKEESLGVFDYNPQDILRHSLSVYDNETVIMFQEIDVKSLSAAYEICEKFRDRFVTCTLRGNCHPHTLENSYLIYIEEKDLNNVCKHKTVKLPQKLRRLFEEGGSPSPTHNEDFEFVQEFQQGLTNYPLIYPKISDLILEFITWNL